jgi:hypothetical protein
MLGTPAGHTLRPMHGMLSAGILIATFALVAVAGLYVAVRVYLAGGPRKAAVAGSRAEAAGTMTERESS